MCFKENTYLEKTHFFFFFKFDMRNCSCFVNLRRRQRIYFPFANAFLSPWKIHLHNVSFHPAMYLQPFQTHACRDLKITPELLCLLSQLWPNAYMWLPKARGSLQTPHSITTWIQIHTQKPPHPLFILVPSCFFLGEAVLFLEAPIRADMPERIDNRIAVPSDRFPH